MSGLTLMYLNAVSTASVTMTPSGPSRSASRCAPITFAPVGIGEVVFVDAYPDQHGRLMIQDVKLPVRLFEGVRSLNFQRYFASVQETKERESIEALRRSTCASSLGGGVDWRLMNAAGAVEASGSGCSSVPIAGVAAGSYTLSVTRPGKTGSYRFKLLSAPPADVFDVTLPASSLSGTWRRPRPRTCTGSPRSPPPRCR